jgi:cytochrome c oxidase cbb3-type subunit I
MVFSIMLWMPSWGGMINGLMTLSGAWDKLRTDPIIRMMVIAIAFYGMATFEGPMMSIKAVNSLSHYTDWTVGHVHSGALGWVGLISFASIYFLVPRLWGRARLYSIRLVNVHVWLATLGIVVYAVRHVGVGHHAGPDVARVRRPGLPRLLLRRDGRGDVPVLRHAHARRLLYLAGALLMVYNITMTILGHQRQEEPVGGSLPSLQPAE